MSAIGQTLVWMRPNSPMLGSAVSIETQNKWLNEVILFVSQETVTPWAHSWRFLPTGAVLAVLRRRGRDVCLHPRLCWLLLPDRDEQPRSRVPEAPQWNHRWLWWGETADFQDKHFKHAEGRLWCQHLLFFMKSRSLHSGLIRSQKQRAHSHTCTGYQQALISDRNKHHIHKSFHWYEPRY